MIEVLAVVGLAILVAIYLKVREAVAILKEVNLRIHQRL